MRQKECTGSLDQILCNEKFMKNRQSRDKRYHKDTTKMVQFKELIS